MTISRAGSASFGFTGRIDSGAPAAGSKASLSAAAPDDLSDIDDLLREEADGAPVDHAEVDAALGRITGMSVEQAASLASPRLASHAGAGAQLVLAILQSREGVC